MVGTWTAIATCVNHRLSVATATAVSLSARELCLNAILNENLNGEQRGYLALATGGQVAPVGFYRFFYRIFYRTGRSGVEVADTVRTVKSRTT